MTNVWGNPELKSFKNNYIRRVLVDSARVFVHKLLVTDVEEVLLRAAEAGAVFSEDGLPAILPAFEMDDSIEAKFGLKFQIPNFDNELDLSDSNFKQIGDVFIYTKFENNQEIVEKPKSLYVDEVSDKIGSRQVTKGLKGKDVKFLAYFFGIENPETKDEFDSELSQAVDYFQKRMGIPQTGIVDWYTWTSILPNATDRIAAGYAGIKVRVLQSAMRVNGYNVPVTSRFGTETIRSVREFQNANNLRITGRVGYLEWKSLFELK